MARALWLGTAGLTLVLASASSAFAAAQPGAVEEIVVTARKQAENLQETPVSVTALTARDMERRGVANVLDLARVTPGMTYGEFGDLKLSPTSLRGVVGSAGSAGADPAVGYYVDEVYEGQGPGANLDLYDISQVEVLRGPQGALFGRNTIGGVVSITTKKPTDTFEASAMADFGNYSKQRLGASISGPIAPGIVDGKIAVIHDKRGGYDFNDFLKIHVNDHDTWSTRGQLLFRFGAKTELLITGEYNTADQHPLVFETKRYNPAAAVPQLLVASGFKLNTDPFDRHVLSNVETQEKLDSKSLTATFKTEFAGISLVNIASAHKHSYDDRDDTCRCQLQITYDGDPEHVTRATDELRLSGKAGALSWLAGGYVSRQVSHNESFVELGSDLAALFQAPSLTGLRIGSNGTLTTQSEAVFGSLTWTFTDRLDATLGGRYTRDHKTIAYIQTDPLALLGGNASIRASASWSDFTPNANVRYRFTPAIMAYATVSKGFKSGGFNDALGDANGIAFGPENLWNYEAGLKSELFEHRLVLDLAAYDMEWKDIQITTQNPATTFFDPIILNAGKAHSRGVEVELTARPTESLLITANTSIQDAHYDEGKLPTGQRLGDIPFAPTYTGDITAQYTVPLSGGRHVSLFGEYVLRGPTYLTTNEDPDGRVNAFGLVNARLSVASDDGRWRVSLYGKNLGDKTYPTRLFDLFANTLNGQKFISLGEPRVYGVELKFDYF